MVGWRGSGRGTGVDRIRHALRSRGIDDETINQRWPETNFYEESQQPQPEDMDVDMTPDEDVDMTPDEKVDDEDEDVDMTPDEKVDDPKDDVGPKKPVQDPTVQEYDIGSNVLARWEPRKWYLAHVTGWKNGRYNVYFMCGSTKINMSPDSIRPFKCGNPPPRRGEMLNKTFHFSEDEGYVGLWKVRRIEGNGYVCTRLTGGDGTTKNMETFDIGRVIREYLGTEQTARELGPCSDLIVQGSRRRPRRLRR